MSRLALGLLHTAESHRARFDFLLADLSPKNVGWVHCVREELLRQTMNKLPTDRIAAGIVGALAELRSLGARQVLCTCSTLGGLAEQVGRQMGLPTLRIDRPMAEAAVTQGSRILVAACLPSTLVPTVGLLNEVAHARDRRIEIETLLMENAWFLFQAGDEAGFARQIAGIICEARPYPDAIVLAQASMAPVADLLKHLPVPIFCSPRLGVAAALRRLTAPDNETDVSRSAGDRLQRGQMT
ncbi:MAG: hypothetical protein ACREEP_16820 [Dongiaceae bacterium]